MIGNKESEALTPELLALANNPNLPALLSKLREMQNAASVSTASSLPSAAGDNNNNNNETSNVPVAAVAGSASTAKNEKPPGTATALVGGIPTPAVTSEPSPPGSQPESKPQPTIIVTANTLSAPEPANTTLLGKIIKGRFANKKGEEDPTTKTTDPKAEKTYTERIRHINAGKDRDVIFDGHANWVASLLDGLSYTAGYLQSLSHEYPDATIFQETRFKSIYDFRGKSIQEYVSVENTKRVNSKFERKFSGSSQQYSSDTTGNAKVNFNASVARVTVDSDFRHQLDTYGVSYEDNISKYTYLEDFIVRENDRKGAAEPLLISTKITLHFGQGVSLENDISPEILAKALTLFYMDHGDSMIKSVIFGTRTEDLDQSDSKVSGSSTKNNAGAKIGAEYQGQGGEISGRRKTSKNKDSNSYNNSTENKEAQGRLKIEAAKYTASELGAAVLGNKETSLNNHSRVWELFYTTIREARDAVCSLITHYGEIEKVLILSELLCRSAATIHTEGYDGNKEEDDSNLSYRNIYMSIQSFNKTELAPLILRLLENPFLIINPDFKQAKVIENTEKKLTKYRLSLRNLGQITFSEALISYPFEISGSSKKSTIAGGGRQYDLLHPFRINLTKEAKLKISVEFHHKTAHLAEVEARADLTFRTNFNVRQPFMMFKNNYRIRTFHLPEVTMRGNFSQLPPEERARLSKLTQREKLQDQAFNVVGKHTLRTLSATEIVKRLDIDESEKIQFEIQLSQINVEVSRVLPIKKTKAEKMREDFFEQMRVEGLLEFMYATGLPRAANLEGIKSRRELIRLVETSIGFLEAKYNKIREKFELAKKNYSEQKDSLNDIHQQLRDARNNLKTKTVLVTQADSEFSLTQKKSELVNLRSDLAKITAAIQIIKNGHATTNPEASSQGADNDNNKGIDKNLTELEQQEKVIKAQIAALEGQIGLADGRLRAHTRETIESELQLLRQRHSDSIPAYKVANDLVQKLTQLYVDKKALLKSKGEKMVQYKKEFHQLEDKLIDVESKLKKMKDLYVPITESMEKTYDDSPLSVTLHLDRVYVLNFKDHLRYEVQDKADNSSSVLTQPPIPSIVVDAQVSLSDHSTNTEEDLSVEHSEQIGADILTRVSRLLTTSQSGVSHTHSHHSHPAVVGNTTTINPTAENPTACEDVYSKFAVQSTPDPALAQSAFEQSDPRAAMVELYDSISARPSGTVKNPRHRTSLAMRHSASGSSEEGDSQHELYSYRVAPAKAAEEKEKKATRKFFGSASSKKEMKDRRRDDKSEDADDHRNSP